MNFDELLWTNYTSAGLSGSLFNHLSSWSFMNNLNFVNVSFVVQNIRE